jgi:hypothetical protein
MEFIDFVDVEIAAVKVAGVEFVELAVVDSKERHNQ